MDNEFNMDSTVDEITNRITESLGDIVKSTLNEVLEDIIEVAVEDAVENAMQEAISRLVEEFRFETGESKRLMVMTPDKSMLLPVYGKMHINGCRLVIQTAYANFQHITFDDNESALAALDKIKSALSAEELIVEL